MAILFGPLLAEEYLDTSQWVKFSMDLLYDDKLACESIEIAFPQEPKFDGKTATATDQEKMTFFLTALEMPETGFELKQAVDFLVQHLIQSSSKKYIGTIYPYENLNASWYGVLWLDKDSYIRLFCVKSEHFVYFIGTEVTNEIYLDYDSAIENSGITYETMMKDSIKGMAFLKSFKISEIPVFKFIEDLLNN